jgi:hypothetical protein
MVDENVFAQTCSDRRLNDRLSPPFWPTPRPIPHQSGLTTLISLIYVERLIKIHNYVFHAVSGPDSKQIPFLIIFRTEINS